MQLEVIEKLSKNYHGKVVVSSIAITAFLLLTTLASVSQASASTIALSNFAVTPAQSAKGASVTGSLSVQNLDSKNTVSVIVTMYDNGIVVADNSANPTSIAKGDTVTVQLQFQTASSAPHCYTASASPGPVTIGYCESGGRILGGTTGSINTLALVASAVAVASIVVAGTLATRRRRTN